MNPVDVLNQIKRLTTDVIAVGICDEQNFPSINRTTGISARLESVLRTILFF